MTSWRLMAAVLVLACVMFSNPVMADDDGRLKAEVQALLDQCAAGFEKKDLKTVLAASGAGCTIQNRDGRTVDMEAWSRDAAGEMAGWRDVKSSFAVEKAWLVSEDRAGALYSERHEFTRSDDPGHSHAIAARFEAVLTKTPQGWRFLKFIEQEVKHLRDGKESTN